MHKPCLYIFHVYRYVFKYIALSGAQFSKKGGMETGTDGTKVGSDSVEDFSCWETYCEGVKGALGETLSCWETAVGLFFISLSWARITGLEKNSSFHPVYMQVNCFPIFLLKTSGPPLNHAKQTTTAFQFQWSSGWFSI